MDALVGLSAAQAKGLLQMCLPTSLEHPVQGILGSERLGKREGPDGLSHDITTLLILSATVPLAFMLPFPPPQLSAEASPPIKKGKARTFYALLTIYSTPPLPSLTPN